MPKKVFSTALVAEVHRLTADRRSVRQIARKLDVPRSTITAILRDQPVSATTPAPITPTPVAPLSTPTRLLLHPLIRPLVPLPVDVACHPTVARLYTDALVADPPRASELDILAVAFDLPVGPFRTYLNVLAAERLRARFDLVDEEDITPHGDADQRLVDAADDLEADADEEDCELLSDPLRVVSRREEEPAAAPPLRLTLPRSAWTAALERLELAFAVQEEAMAAARDHLLADLSPDISPDE